MPILAPATALIVSNFFVSKWNNDKWRRVIYIIQLIASLLLLITAALVNAWAFPIKNTLVFAVLILLLAIVFY